MQIRYALIAIVALAGAAQAQFPEGWEPGPVTPGVAPVPATWTSVNNSPGGPGTNPNWQVRNDAAVFPANGGTGTYAFANYNSSTGANNISNYLISPLVTFNNGDTISFWTRTVTTPAFPDRLALVYNTTGSVLPADFTNTLLTINPTLTTAGYPTTWTQFTATITGLSGPTPGRLAFHYNPTGGGPAGANSDYIGVDDVDYVSVNTPSVVECAGDTAAMCPCSAAGGSLVPNPGATGSGCANSVFPAGATLSSSGSAVDNAGDTLVLSCANMTGPGLFIQSNSTLGPVLNFNDGAACALGGIIRLGVVFPTPAGVGNFGAPANPIHTLGAPVLVGGSPTAETKHYQCWYRDNPTFCNPAVSNMSNGLAIVWAP